MRSLYPLSKIRNCLGFTRKFGPINASKHYVIYKSKEAILLPIRFTSNSSSVPSYQNENKNLSENAESKKTFWKIINEAYIILQNPDVKPTILIQQIEHGENKQKMWQVSISMIWPKEFQVQSIASKKSDAEKSSFALACQKIKEFGVLDKNNIPIFPKRNSILEEDNVSNSKSVLCNIYEVLWPKFGKKEYIPKFNTFQLPGLIGEDKYWKSELALAYPAVKTFEAFAVRRREAERIVSAKALQWLKNLGLINKQKKLIQYSREEDRKLLELHSSPYSICIPKPLQSEMTSLLQTLETEDNIISPEVLKNECQEISKLNNFEIYDVITDKPYKQQSGIEIVQRSTEMLEGKKIAENCDPETQKIKTLQSQLPIYRKKEEILKLIEENQVLVISGETGCGKTTQVPQFILDHYISKMEGALCNVVVTQPRRISAISIAERVAKERGEKVGESVGYQVRLNKMLPAQKGAILYCSTGMLLRKLCSNPTLEGVSHVVVDEVHERNIQIDFLLILLKRLIENNKTIKILIMSASFNTIIFSHYFNNCPVIHTTGRNFPVKDFYLEDILTEKEASSLDKKDPVLDCDLVTNIINHIDKFQKPGAILCFLPGWHDILTVKNNLLNQHPNPSRLMICCAHSRLPHDEQKKLFNAPPENVRKVILATNIAETSITVSDVIYVIDSGLYKGTSFDSEQAITSLATQWITKANVRQRSGRAGRVQSGICYHLFTRKVLMKMDDYPLPELLRMPLESVILDCKRYCPESKAEEFLSTAIQAPSRSSLQSGVEELQIIGILDESEHLTDLGKIVVNFGTHPRLSVALVYAAFLRCLDPVLTICSAITVGKEPFLNTLEDKSLIKNVKKAYDNSLISDHLSVVKIFEGWNKLNAESSASEFVEQNFLDEKNLKLISDLKSLFAENLSTVGIIDDKNAFSDSQNKCNENSHHIPSILASLTVAFYPNIIKVLQGEISQNRFNKDTLVYSLLKGQRGYIQKESVASNEGELPTPWLTYFSALQSKARRLMMTSAVSSVPGICIPLLAGKQLSLDVESSKTSDTVTLILDEHKKLNFSCTNEESELILQFRNRLDDFFKIYVHSLHTKSEKCDYAMSFFYDHFLPVLKGILESPQVPFTKGQTYKFIDDCLESKDL